MSFIGGPPTEGRSAAVPPPMECSFQPAWEKVKQQVSNFGIDDINNVTRIAEHFTTGNVKAKNTQDVIDMIDDALKYDLGDTRTIDFTMIQLLKALCFDGKNEIVLSLLDGISSIPEPGNIPEGAYY